MLELRLVIGLGSRSAIGLAFGLLKARVRDVTRRRRNRRTHRMHLASASGVSVASSVVMVRLWVRDRIRDRVRVMARVLTEFGLV